MNKTDTVIPDRVFKFNESVKNINGTIEEKQVIDPKKITPKLKSMLPQPTGWRLMVLPYRGTGKTKGGVYLADETVQVYNAATVCGYVISAGPDAYKDTSKFPDGPWCKEKDWVIFGRYAGARLQIEGGEIRLLNDDEILATISNPEDILHIY